MGLTDRIHIEVCQRTFVNADGGKRVYGKLGSHNNVCVRARLGQEVEDLGYHPDSRSEYRKFIQCTVEFAESIDLLKQGRVIQGATVYGKTVWLYS